MAIEACACGSRMARETLAFFVKFNYRLVKQSGTLGWKTEPTGMTSQMEAPPIDRDRNPRAQALYAFICKLF